MPRIDLSAAVEQRGFELPTTIGEGGRDVTLHAYASSLQARGVGDSQIVALVMEANAERCVPPLPDWQARKCAESAIRSYEKGAGGEYGRRVREVPQRPVRRVSRRGMPERLPDMSGLEPLAQARAWLSAMFFPDDVVCLVLEPESRFPTTEWYAHAGQLCDPCDPLLGKLLGAAHDCGVWCVQNPIRDHGGRRRNADVADFRWALVESDELPADEQLERMCALLFETQATGWKCKALTWSGNKSWHAEVYVGAPDEDSYRAQVDELYRYCDANGLPVDHSCRNPARLTRLAGAWRAETGQRQWLRWCDA